MQGWTCLDPGHKTLAEWETTTVNETALIQRLIMLTTDGNSEQNTPALSF